MAASVSTIGYGGTLEWSTDGGTTWTALTELRSCAIPTNTYNKADRTHQSSPSRTKEYTPGLMDPQDVSFSFGMNSADYEALYTLELAATVAKWRHTLAPEDDTTTGAIYQYDGFVALGDGSVETEETTAISATIHRVGAYTFTAAT